MASLYFDFRASSAASAEGEDKVVICLIPPGNPENAHLITVSASAVDAHLANGSTLYECPSPEELAARAAQNERGKTGERGGGQGRP